MTLTWPKARRLTCRAQYTACYDRGSRHYTRNFVVFALERAALPVESTSDSSIGSEAVRSALCCPAAFGENSGASDVTGATKERVAGQSGLTADEPCDHLGSRLCSRLGCPLVGRLGLAVTRKCGNAAERNRIKRVLREFFRLHQHDMPVMDIVVTPKRHLRADKVHLALVERDLAPLLETLRRTGRSTAPDRRSAEGGLSGGLTQPGARSSATAPLAGGSA